MCAVSCRSCGKVVQAEAPSPIDRGIPGPGLLAHVLVAKYADTCRSIGRARSLRERASTSVARLALADWVGAASKLLRHLSRK